VCPCASVRVVLLCARASLVLCISPCTFSDSNRIDSIRIESIRVNPPRSPPRPPLATRATLATHMGPHTRCSARSCAAPRRARRRPR
jgi:hypothetical protein